MAYKGSVFPVICSQGGLTGATAVNDIPSEMMLYGSRNLNLEKGGRRKRGGTAYVNANAFADTPKVLGIQEFKIRAGTQFIVCHTNDGKIYKNATDTIKTGWGTTGYTSFAQGDDTLFMCDGASVPQVWSGSSNTADIHEAAADWGAAPPHQFLLHGRLASMRMWAVNKTTVYASKSWGAALDMQHFSTGAESIVIDTGDSYGLVGIAEFGDRLMAFGKNQAYNIDDTDATPANWGWSPSQWKGGAAHRRLLVNTTNDLIAMAEDGEVYSIGAVNQYGDYKAASLTKDSWMHDFIKAYVNLTYINDFHGVYDPLLRAVVIFVALQGSTTPNAALLYFVDRAPKDAWMLHDNTVYASGYGASASCAVRTAAGSNIIYTGSTVGRVWKLNQTTRSDQTNGYYNGFVTPSDPFKLNNIIKHYNALSIITEASGDHTIGVGVYVDGEKVKDESISLTDSTATLGAFALGTDTLAGASIKRLDSRLGVIGERIQYEIYNDTPDEDFFISEYVTQFKHMGVVQK